MCGCRKRRNLPNRTPAFTPKAPTNRVQNPTPTVNSPHGGVQLQMQSLPSSSSDSNDLIKRRKILEAQQAAIKKKYS